ncbi:MAG TPA: FAD-dependent oxidoreductase, partial [Pyrinomonadaceae bacterium]
PHAGGQIWRASKGKIGDRTARRLIGEIENLQVKFLYGAQVFDATADNCLLAETHDGAVEIVYEKLIIAAGARERFLPFPGWTLPGVYGAGGLQALVKAGLNVRGKRIVVAGTGALLLAVAAYLRSRGAKVLAIAEQASPAKIRRFAISLSRSPAKIAQAVILRSKLIGVPYLTDCWITSAYGEDRIKQVELTRNGRSWSLDCDMLACGFHLVPNTELADLIGCKIKDFLVVTDEYQQTSKPNIYCAGEPTGIAGVEAALVEGTIAGLAATGKSVDAERSFRKRERTRAFGDLLDETFALRDDLKLLPKADTIVCRCEDVEFSRLQTFASFREAKLQTRCGMGPCQGRICGAATQFLFGWEPPGVRPPIFPVKMEHL